MTLQNKNIAVLMGGPGAERAVSLTSGAAVAKALRSLGAKPGAAAYVQPPRRPSDGR